MIKINEGEFRMNTVNKILENLKLNEVKSINLGNGKTAYQVGDKYYIKSGDNKKKKYL